MARYVVQMTDQNGGQFAAYEDAITANAAAQLALAHMGERFPGLEWTIGEASLRVPAGYFGRKWPVISMTMTEPYSEPS